MRAASEELRRLIRGVGSAQAELDEARAREGRMHGHDPAPPEPSLLVLGKSAPASADTGGG